MNRSFLEREIPGRDKKLVGKRAREAAKISLGYDPVFNKPAKVETPKKEHSELSQTILGGILALIGLFLAGLILYGLGSVLYSVDKGIRDGIRGYSDSDKAAYKTHWQRAEDCYKRGDMEGAADHIEKSTEDGSYPYEN